MEVVKTVTSVFKPTDLRPASTQHETEVSSILCERLTQSAFRLLSVLFVFVSQAAPVRGTGMLGEMLELLHPRGWVAGAVQATPCQARSSARRQPR